MDQRRPKSTARCRVLPFLALQSRLPRDPTTIEVMQRIRTDESSCSYAMRASCCPGDHVAQSLSHLMLNDVLL